MARAHTRKINQRNSTAALFVRFAVYTLTVLCFAAALPWLARIGDAAAFKENGLVEWLQFGMLLAVGLIFARNLGRSQQYQHVFLIFACLAAFAATREMDGNLDATVPWLGWKIGYAFIVIAAFASYRNWDTLLRQMRQCLESNGFFLLWAGFIIAIPFAQLVGNGAFLQAIMNDDYSRDYRRIIEEIGELMGYGLILIGSIELAIKTADSKVLFQAKHWRQDVP